MEKMEPTQSNSPDYTGGLSFFKWITRSFIDKLYSYGLTLGIITGLIAMNYYGTYNWPTDDLGFAYGIDVFFGIITLTLTKKTWGFPLVTIIMCAVTYFFAWFGWVQGFGLFILYAYWGGYYKVYQNLKKGITS